MRFTKALVLLTVFLTALPLLAQQQPANPQQPMPMPPGQPMPMPPGGSPHAQMPDCQAMMQKMQSMHAAQKAMDDKLAALVADMNKAKGSAKIDRMAAVINEMVTQRGQMREEMAAMMPQMMNHMMEHMQSGMMSGMHSMENCPMMSGSGQPAQPAPPDHKH